jgi:hypothetical protein
MPNSDLYLMYQLTDSSDTILRLADGAFIPRAPGNRDYADFLAWQAEGNEPLPPPPPPAPGPDYQAFWEGLMASSLYAAIREQSMVSLPMNTLGTEFIALLGDAKAGRPYEAAIQASMAAIVQAGTFTPEQLAELQAVLEASHLDGIYVLMAAPA